MEGSKLAAAILGEVRRAVVGKDEVLAKVLLAILAGGHILLEDNPGVKEALSMREHSVSIRKRNAEEQHTRPVIPEEAKAPMPQPGESRRQEHVPPEQSEPRAVQRFREPESGDVRESSDGEESSWPYGSSERKPSKTAWWRNLGRGRKRDMEGK